MFSGLQVRDKLNLLVVLPLVLVALLLVPLLSGRISEAQLSARTASVAAEARQLSELIQDLQQARLLAVARLRSDKVDPSALVVELQLVSEQRVQVQQIAAANGDEALITALGAVERLIRITEPNLVERTASAQATITAFSAAVDQLIKAADLTRKETVQPADGWALSSLDSLLRSNESVSRAGALLLAATSTTSAAGRAQLLGEATQYFARGEDAGRSFQRQASERTAAVFAQATDSISSTRIVDAQAQISRSATLSDDQSVAVFAAVQSATGLRQLVQSDITQGVATDATEAARQAQLFVVLISMLAALLMALVVALSVVVGRSVSRPLRRLTVAAAAVADLAQDELLRVADEDATVGVVPQLAEIDISSADEIGELAQAFNRVQSTAAQLLERQVVSRRNVASMFASVGRRTTNLVGRQLSLIDTLERTEQDPDTLSTLYRLDHLSTRLRRNANSLVVLSGGSEASGEGRPVSVSDAVRAALGSVEDYKRVTIARLPNAYLSPGVVSDLLLLLAELLENAVLFSPPRTTVEVHARLGEDGSCRLSIVDHGMGMAADRLAEENARLERRERLDLAPTNVLGLFVVGRIARRHGLDVSLEPTADHGVTVQVLLPATALVDVAANAMPAMPPSSDVVAARSQLVAAGAGGLTAGAAVRGAADAAAADQAWTFDPDLALSLPQLRKPPPLPPAVRPAAAEPATAPAAAAVPGATVERPVARRVPGSHWSPDGGSQPPPPPPPSGATGVKRRVPGSQLPPVDQPVAAVVVPAEGLNPDEARKQVAELEQAMAKAADDGVNPQPASAPSMIDLARRAGVRRRIPGVALDEIGGLPVEAAPVSSTGFDAEAVRVALDDVGSAVDRADQVHHRTSLSAERFADEAARAAAQAEATARVAALQEAAGRRGAQRQTITDLAGELRAGALDSPPDEPPPAPVEPVGPGAIAGVTPPPARRVPGAALAALGRGAPDLTGPASELPTGPIALGVVRNGRGGGRVIDHPERPEAVLSWVEGLESAIAAAEPVAEAPAPEEPAGDGSDTRSHHDTETGEVS
jgi:signal transduction histidine kinase